jgi:hypothetical protein
MVEDLEFLPGVRGVGRSEGNTRPVYGAIFATGIIGVIEFTPFLLARS